MANSVSENIRKLRQKKGISQDRLSKEADIALNTVVKIETGEMFKPDSWNAGKDSQGPCRFYVGIV